MADTKVFYFAWVDETETTFGPEHQVYDESVFSFSIEHREGDCPTLSLTIENPHVGLLSAGRKIWAWLSYADSGTDAVAIPLFFGRLAGIPENVFANQVTLQFVAKPLDYVQQRRDLAESMAVLPFYDPIFIDENLRLSPTTTDGPGTGDIDAVLEAYSARFHIDRTTLAVTTSDICVGEDGTETFESTTDDMAGIDPTAISLSKSGTPQSSVTIKAQVNWTQQVPTGPAIHVGDYLFPTYTGNSLLSGWPKPGASIGGGWSAAAQTYAIDLTGVDQLQNSNINFSWQNRAKQHVTGDSMSLNVNRSSPVVRGAYRSGKLYEFSQPGVVGVEGFNTATTSWTVGQGDLGGDPDDNGDVINIPLHYDSAWVVVPQSLIQASLWITYETGRDRTEHVSFTLTSDVQEVEHVFTDEQDENIIEINGADVGVPLFGSDGQVAPLFDPNADSYFPTERGLQSLEYLLLRARAVLLAGARLVDLSWPVPFDRAVNFTCRKNATLVWNKLPGGTATGKITTYTIFADGSTGKLGGTVTVSCAVGHGIGETYSASAGTADYVDGVFDPGSVQTATGAISTDLAGDLAYSPPIANLVKNAIALTRDDVLVSETIHGNVNSQIGLIDLALASAYSSGASDINNKQNATQNAQAFINNYFNSNSDNSVWLELKLKTVDQLALEDEYTIDTQPLLVPKTIDLEAP